MAMAMPPLFFTASASAARTEPIWLKVEEPGMRGG
jgi:hypothetical protein